MRIQLILHLLFALLFMKSKAHGQYVRINSNYSLYRYNSENGLPQNTINAIAQDGDGYIWLASQGGLVKWDGLDFTIINSNKKEDQPLTRIANLLVQCSPDSIYCITNDGKISLIRKGRVSPMIFRESEELIRRNLFLFKNKSKQFINHSNEAYIIENKKNSTDIHYIHYQEDHIFRLNRSLRLTPILFSDSIFFEDENKQWYYIYKKTKNAIDIRITGDLLKNPNRKYKTECVLDHKNLQLIRCGDSFYLVQKKGNVLHTTLLFSYPIPDIISSYYDTSSRQVLFGTSASGLYVIKKNNFLAVTDEYNKTGHIYQNQLYGQIRVGDNIISNAGFAYNLRQKRVYLHPFHFNKSIHQLSDSSIWCENNGGFTLNQFNSKLQLIKTYKGLETLKNNNYVTDILELPNKEKLFATIEGLLSINKNDSLIKEKIINNGLREVSGIECLALINEHTIWIGTRNGIYSHDILQKSTRLLPGTGLLNVRKIKVDPSVNTIWISTYGQGPYCYRNNKLISFPIDKKEYLKQNHFFAEDNMGNFWIPTNNGLFEIPKQQLLDYADKKVNTLNYYYWSYQDGFLTNEFNGGANLPYIKTTDGLFSFPTINGLVLFHADSVQHINTQHPVSVSSITVNGENIVNYDSTLKVNSSYKNIKIGVSVAYFGNRNNLILQYCISTNEKEWIDVPADNQIIINKAVPGTYAIYIKTIEGFNQPAKVTKLLELTVLPMWHETMLFRVLCIICILALTGWLVKMRIEKTERKNKELKRLVDEKTLELSNTINNLEKTVEEKELLLLTLSHDILAPLNFSFLTSQDIVSQWENLSDNRKQKMSQLLSNTLRKTSLFVSDFLTWVSFDCDTEISLQPLNILDFLQSIPGKYSTHGNNPVEFDCNQDLIINSNKRILEIIVGNIFNNAAKYSKGEPIVLSAYKSDDEVIISCRDHGQGMTAVQVNNILLNAPSKGADYHKSFKLGYRIIKFFLTKIDATMTISSNEGEGTEVKIYLKLKK